MTTINLHIYLNCIFHKSTQVWTKDIKEWQVHPFPPHFIPALSWDQCLQHIILLSVRMYLYTPRWFSSETSVGHSNWPSCYNDFALGWRKNAHAEKAAHYHPILKLTDSCYYLHRSCILMSLHFSEEAAQPCPWRLSRLCGQSVPWRVMKSVVFTIPKGIRNSSLGFVGIAASSKSTNCSEEPFKYLLGTDFIWILSQITSDSRVGILKELMLIITSLLNVDISIQHSMPPWKPVGLNECSPHCGMPLNLLMLSFFWHTHGMY